MKETFGGDMGVAAVGYYGLPLDNVIDVEFNTDVDDVLSVTFTVAMGAQDLKAIAENMQFFANVYE